MKIFISADMEGISGVVDPDHVDASHPEYQRFRQIMTGDVNAAIRGVFTGGGEQVLVADAHGNKTNILIENLDERAELNSGGMAPYGMVQGAEDGFDGAVFVGYHARMGAQDAILSHTIHSGRVANVWLNDRLAGEIGLNAAFCGHFATPVILLTGDLAACQEAQEWVTGIETVAVKKATSRHSARCLSLKESQRLIEAAAMRAVKRLAEKKAPEVMHTRAPVKIVVEFLKSSQTDLAAALPGSQRLDGRRLQIETPDMAAAYRTLKAAINLANA